MDSIVGTFQNAAAEPLPAVLLALGSVAVLKFVAGLVSGVYKTFLRPGKNLRKLGKWAVITGATDGIGKAYAKALAKKGLSIVLISRTESKLQDVAKEIDDSNFPTEKTKIIVCDYSKFDDAAKARVAKELEGLEIGVLINNVGQSYRYPRFFHELPSDEVSQLIAMNIDSTMTMTRMVLDGMLERKRGTVVNVSSASAMYTMPLLAEYASAKAFVEKLSKTLDSEYAAKGVTFQCQVPFYVATKLAKLRKSLTVPTADAYVALAMRWVGHGDRVVSPFWLHGLQGWVMDRMPEWLVVKGAMSMHLGIRKRGLKKDAKQAEEAGKKAE